MVEYSIPYGRTSLTFELPDHFHVDVIAPRKTPAAPDPVAAVSKALTNPLGGIKLSDFTGVTSAAIAINDKTRPVPHEYLLPPLMDALEKLGISPAKTSILIAAGVHPPMPFEEYALVVPEIILSRYPVKCHNSDDLANLVYLGETDQHTPIWINRLFWEADLRIVVGNIEPHQFQGFSGGVKSAAIGLAGRKTINQNHALMMDPASRLGEFESNPARQDVEDIGQIIGVHFALNTILNEKKEIVHVIGGTPQEVMKTGIPLSRKICQVRVSSLYDMMIVSPGGYPKDINFYQSQKGLAHASLITRDKGTIILAAACSEGPGSQKFEDFVMKLRSIEELLKSFRAQGFKVGPHKAYQIVRDSSRVQVILMTELERDFVKRLLLDKAPDITTALASGISRLPLNARVGILPLANATIPYLS